MRRRSDSTSSAPASNANITVGTFVETDYNDGFVGFVDGVNDNGIAICVIARNSFGFEIDIIGRNEADFGGKLFRIPLFRMYGDRDLQIGVLFG